jgi:hypothetical protein
MISNRALTHLEAPFFGGPFLEALTWRPLLGGPYLEALTWRPLLGGPYLEALTWRPLFGGPYFFKRTKKKHNSAVGDFFK